MLTPDSIKTIISLTCNEASLHTLIMLQGLVKALQQTDAAITERGQPQDIRITGLLFTAEEYLAAIVKLTDEQVKGGLKK